MLTTKDYCDEFECAVVNTCYHPFCNGDNCHYASFCFVCKKKETCKINLFEKLCEKKEKREV